MFWFSRFKNEPSIDEKFFLNDGNGLIRINLTAHGYEFTGWLIETSTQKMSYKCMKLLEEWPIITEFQLNVGKFIDDFNASKVDRHGKLRTRVAFIHAWKGKQFCKFYFDRSQIGIIGDYVDDVLVNAAKFMPIKINTD